MKLPKFKERVHKCEQQEEFYEVGQRADEYWYVYHDGRNWGIDDAIVIEIKHCPFCGVKLDES